MRKARRKIPGAERHLAKDAEVPFSGLLIHVDVLPKRTPTSGPAAPRSNVWFRDLQGKTRCSATSANVMMMVANGWRQIRMRPQQSGKLGRDGPCGWCRFAWKGPKVSIGERPAGPHRLMRGMPSGEKGGNSGNTES